MFPTQASRQLQIAVIRTPSSQHFQLFLNLEVLFYFLGTSPCLVLFGRYIFTNKYYYFLLWLLSIEMSLLGLSA